MTNRGSKMLALAESAKRTSDAELIPQLKHKRTSMNLITNTI